MSRQMTNRQNEREKGNRPFPWDCPSCGKGEVHPTTLPYTAEIKHDGLTHTIHIAELKTPKCRACGEILFSDSADEQINAAFRSKVKLLTPSQIRKRRRDLDLNQSELAERIGAAEGTISRWETGALIQSRTSDNLLRVYFAFRDVRTALVGGDQDPDLGLKDETPSDDGVEEAWTGISEEFTYATEAYGEEGLNAEIAYFRRIGSLLPVGRS